jgi:hypothetical protein
MPDLSQVLVVGVSSRALFDLEEANAVYETQGLDAYVRYQVDRADGRAAERFSRRMDVAVRAAVGLDPGRRQQ